MEFYIVGSALTEEEPRDIDMFGVMEDHVFTANFGLTPIEFEKYRKKTIWGPELTKWWEQSIGAMRALQFVFPQLVPIDFKYLPNSLLQEPCRKINITAPPESWGIGFPNLENHVKEGPTDEF